MSPQRWISGPKFSVALLMLVRCCAAGRLCLLEPLFSVEPWVMGGATVCLNGMSYYLKNQNQSDKNSKTNS